MNVGVGFQGSFPCGSCGFQGFPQSVQSDGPAMSVCSSRNMIGSPRPEVQQLKTLSCYGGGRGTRGALKTLWSAVGVRVRALEENTSGYLSRR